MISRKSGSPEIVFMRRRLLDDTCISLTGSFVDANKNDPLRSAATYSRGMDTDKNVSTLSNCNY